MASYNIYASRNDWLANRATVIGHRGTLASAKAAAIAAGATHISSPDGRTWHVVAGVWRRA